MSPDTVLMIVSLDVLGVLMELLFYPLQNVSPVGVFNFPRVSIIDVALRPHAIIGDLIHILNTAQLLV